MTESRTKNDIASEAARWVARRDAGLTSIEQREFDQWLAADPTHAAALEHYSKTWSVFDRPRRNGAADSILLEMAAQTRRRQRRITATVSVLTVLLVAGYLWRFHPTANSLSTPPASAVVLLPEKRTLPDGSQVELKPGAQIAVDYVGTFRRVALQKGEAHFQVAKNKDRPFIVSAGGIEVRAVGTAFSVDLGSKEVDVLVTEGRVAVEKSRRAASAETGRPAIEQQASGDQSIAGHSASQKISAPTFVDAGHRLVIPVAPSHGASDQDSPALVATTVSSDELAKRLAWRTPRLEFSDTPLAAAVELMNRSSVPQPGSPKFRLVIDPDSPDLAREPVSGLFRADSTEGFVHVLELSLGVKAERSEDTIILRRP